MMLIYLMNMQKDLQYNRSTVPTTTRSTTDVLVFFVALKKSLLDMMVKCLDARDYT